MSKKTLFSLIASILGVTGIAESSTSKLEVSIGGSRAEFPEGSKGFLIVDTAGDGFDFAKSPTILENKSHRHTHLSKKSRFTQAHKEHTL